MAGDLISTQMIYQPIINIKWQQCQVSFLYHNRLTSRSESLKPYVMFQPRRPYFFLSWMTPLNRQSPKRSLDQTGDGGSSNIFSVTTPVPPLPYVLSMLAFRPWGGSTVICNDRINIINICNEIVISVNFITVQKGQYLNNLHDDKYNNIVALLHIFINI